MLEGRRERQRNGEWKQGRRQEQNEKRDHGKEGRVKKGWKGDRKGRTKVGKEREEGVNLLSHIHLLG